MITKPNAFEANAFPGVSVAARDWGHAAWVGAYYPHDLPEDWRLAYLANELRAVLVPQWRLDLASPETCADWADDVHPAFRFLLELGPDAGARVEWLAEMLAAFDDKLGAVVVAHPAAWPKRSIAALTEGLGARRVALATPLGGASAAGAGVMWRATLSEPVPVAPIASIGADDIGSSTDLSELEALLRRFAAAVADETLAPNEEAFVVLDHPAFDPAALARAQVLADLLRGG